MGRIKPRRHLRKSIISQALEKKKSATDLLEDDCLLISLRQIDRTQGQTVHHWEAVGMLANAIEVLAGACSGRATEIFNNKKFTLYGSFPSADKTAFFHPKHIPEDAQWARIHIDGLHCVIGHIVRNTFYLVFFDGNHEFWRSEKK